MNKLLKRLLIFFYLKIKEVLYIVLLFSFIFALVFGLDYISKRLGIFKIIISIFLLSLMGLGLVLMFVDWIKSNWEKSGEIMEMRENEKNNEK